MDKRMWKWILLENVGIPTIVAIVLGVPAMIVLIVDIWQVMSLSQQIVAGVSCSVIALAVALFVWGRIKKKLYAIPPILTQMKARTMELAKDLDAVKPINENHDELKSLMNIDIDQLMSSLETQDIEGLKSGAKEVFKMAEVQSQKAREQEGQPMRIFWFFYEIIGLKRALDTDMQYTQLTKELNKIQPHIPNVETNKAIVECKNMSRIIGTFLPIFSMSDPQILQVLPLPYKLDCTMKMEELDNMMNASIAKVRECIDNYYRSR